MKKVTSMQISVETINKLHDLKNRGNTYEDVIIKLLQHYDNHSELD